jgi:ActR/RegA family two-component response regulator
MSSIAEQQAVRGVIVMSSIEQQKLGRVLLVSRDFAATRQIGDAMQEHGMSVEISTDISLAWEKLSRRKYEAIVVDASLGQKALYLFQQIRQSTAHRTAVTFAITDDQSDTALALKHGFGFALERPLTQESIAHTLKVAYGLILRERRRYFRHPVIVPAVLSRKASEIFARTINISEGGVAIQTSVPLEPGLEAGLEFTLDDPRLRIKCDARVCWQNEDGKAGLSFVAMPFDLISALNQWLALKLEELLPSHTLVEV